ncbi:vWA domain-containing protein [Tepidiforma bonchosmolovskayae]|uniref:vWA domain-containing protein n=1 Tax=Tepidiforma bonchosmolovskayae TaxID=2601677 RepID=UPI001788710A|nr:vWA domain-containing protein [Tepidiforma bonchosmolovskayae]
MADPVPDLAGASPAARAAALQADLEALYRSWGILDLVGETVDTLPPEWLRILNIARTLREGLPLPGVDLPEPTRRLVQPARPEYQVIERREQKHRIVYPVQPDTRIQPLRHIEDLPQVTMPDLLMRDLDPAIFEFRLLSGDINALYHVDPGPAEEDYDEIREERVLVSPPAGRRRQRVYVLLDVSNSMREANKLLFAKALVLAYLITACEERAQLFFRTFANRVHPRTDCLEPAAFPALARRILQVTPDGSTDIRAALAAAVGDIADLDGVGRGRDAFETSPTELLLISDCESYAVPSIPRGIRLHTIHLSGGPMAKSYAAGFEQIREASTTFAEIDTTRLVMPGLTRERWLLQQDGRLGPLDTEAAEAGRRPGDRLERRNALLRAYERMAERQPAQGDRAPAPLLRAPGFGLQFSLRRLLRRYAAVLHRLRRQLFPRRRPAPGGLAPAGPVTFRPRR